jgi:acyl-CoA synthetase (NDP forming)/RimJ/RimL family protein N-acetyltransferase
MSVDDGRDRWATSVVLGDGEVAYLRPITPEDAPTLLAFHERQPRENLYRRFFSAKPTLTARELVYFTTVDFKDRVALVLEHHGEFVAWASYERWQDRDDADVAFMVDDSIHGKGIATLMLEHLAVIARTNGIGKFTAEVLSDNRPMLRVFARAGWPVERHYDSGITELEWSLDDTEQFVGSVAEREQRADSRAMARLLLPRSIAVIGASDEPGSIGHELWQNVTSDFGGPVWPVNPAHDTVGGRPCAASVADIADDVWLAIVAVPAAALADTIESCIAKHVRGAVIVTATEGAGIDVPALVAHARRNGMRIIGPTSMGIASPRASGGVQAALARVPGPRGGVAISLQSGSLGASVLQLAAQQSIGISWFVSLGDKADVSGNDLLQFWEDDESTKVIAIYTESFGNPRKFARITRRVARRRPIVTVRTGAAAGGSATDALYQQAGLIEVPTVRMMLDVARVLETQPVPQGPSVAILTNAHSPGVLAAAAVESAGLRVVDPPVPLDWRSSADDVDAAIRAALAADEVDALMVIHAPPLASSPPPLDAIDAATTGATKPVVAVMLGRADGRLRPGSRVPAFSFPEPAAEVLGRLAAYHRWLVTEADPGPEGADGGGTEGTSHDAPAVEGVLVEARAIGRDRLALDETIAVLGAYGLVMPSSVVLDDASTDEVVAAARLIGHPVALKAVRRHVGRSAEAGVALDLADDEAVRDAHAVIVRSLGEDASRLVVQQMVPPGVDVRITCTTDPRLGPVITVGLGSLQAELPGAVSRLVPVSPAGADAMIDGSPVGAALARAGLDRAGLVDAIGRVSRLLFDHHGIETVSIDPVIVSAHGCHLTDVRIQLGDGRDVSAVRKL